MKKNITPGPWTNTIQGVTNENGKLIAQCWYGYRNDSYGNIPAIGSHDEYCANGNAIAAVPELLEQAYAYRHFIEFILDNEELWKKCPDFISKASLQMDFVKVENALLKATK